MKSFTQRVLSKKVSLESAPQAFPEEDGTLKDEMAAAEKESSEIEGELDQCYQYYDDNEIHILPEGKEPEDIQRIIHAGEKLEEEIGWNSQQMPSTEALDLSRVKELIHTFLETTKQLIIKLYENMDYYWDKIVLRLNNLMNVCNRIKDECQEKVGKSKSGDTFVSNRMTLRSIFFFKDEILNDYDKVHSRYNELKTLTTEMFSHWTSHVAETGIKVTSILEALHPEEIDAALDNCNALTQQLFDNLDTKYKSEIELMGGIRIRLHQSEEFDNSSNTKKAVSLMSQSFYTEGSESPITEEFKVKIFSLEEIVTLMDEIFAVANHLKDDLNNNRLPRLSANTRRMVKGAVRKYGRMDTLVDETHYADKVNLTYRYGFAYGKWIRSPSMAMATLLVTVSRGIQTLSREMLAEYR